MDRSSTLRCMHHWPTRSLCIAMVILQAASLDYYLIVNLGTTWAGVIVADVLSVSLFVAATYIATTNFHEEKKLANVDLYSVRHMPTTYIAWFVHSALLDVKVGVIFAEFSETLDENSFFGPNTLKTSIALSGLIFVSFLATQHDVRIGTRRLLIDKLTATVIFDILDGVDSLDILFDKDVRDALPNGFSGAMIVICCLTFVLPTIPLFTLALTRFGLKKLPEKYELLHKISLAYLVNLPLFILRMITWHGVSQGISIFALKNLIALGVATFEVVEHRFLQVAEEKEEEHKEMDHIGTNNSGISM